MFSQTAEYALRAAVCLAADPERPLTNPELARLARVPAGYLAKVMPLLVRAGLVRSRRGRGGGFLLAAPAREVSVLSVVEAVDPIRRLSGCPLGLPAHRGGLCPLHRRLEEVAASLQQSLDAIPVAALLRGAGRRTPLCLPSRGRQPAACTRPVRRPTSCGRSAPGRGRRPMAEES